MASVSEREAKACQMIPTDLPFLPTYCLTEDARAMRIFLRMGFSSSGSTTSYLLPESAKFVLIKEVALELLPNSNES